MSSRWVRSATLTLAVTTACGGATFESGGADPRGDADAGPEADGGNADSGADSKADPDAMDASPETEASACDGDLGPFTHSDGLGDSWKDCVPTGTYTGAEAMRACLAYAAAADAAARWCALYVCNGAACACFEPSGCNSSALCWVAAAQLSVVECTSEGTVIGTWK